METKTEREKRKGKRYVVGILNRDDDSKKN